MSEKHICYESVYDGFSTYPCGRKAKVCVDGKWYCGIHDPARAEARREKSRKRWEEKQAIWNEDARRHDAIIALVGHLTTDEIEALVKQKKQKEGDDGND